MQKAFLFPWNESKWAWPDIADDIRLIKKNGKITEKWRCNSYKTIRKGDRAFLTRVGSSPRGIFGSGFVASEPFESPNKYGGRPVYRVSIDIDILLDPSTQPILTLDILNAGPLSQQLWTPQSSGISIRAQLVEELEAVWSDFLSESGIDFHS